MCIGVLGYARNVTCEFLYGAVLHAATSDVNGIALPISELSTRDPILMSLTALNAATQQ